MRFALSTFLNAIREFVRAFYGILCAWNIPCGATNTTTLFQFIPLFYRDVMKLTWAFSNVDLSNSPNFLWNSSGRSFWSGNGIKPWPSNFNCPVFQRFQSIFGFESPSPSRTGEVGEICVGCAPLTEICFFTRHLRSFFLKSGVRFSSRSFAEILLLKTGCWGCSSGLGGVIKAIAIIKKIVKVVWNSHLVRV